MCRTVAAVQTRAEHALAFNGHQAKQLDCLRSACRVPWALAAQAGYDAEAEQRTSQRQGGAMKTQQVQRAA